MIETFLVKETKLDRAWYTLIQNVLKQKDHLTRKPTNIIHFGSPLNLKTARDSCQICELTGRGIDDVLNSRIHEQSTFKALASYRNEFKEKFMWDWRSTDQTKRFDYLYLDRIWDQFDKIRNNLKEQINYNIQSNYCQAITWNPQVDGTNKHSSPCLQQIWIRYDPLTRGVEIHLHWRSRDLYNAWQANIVAVIGMINEYILLPCGITRIDKIVDSCDSLQIYEADLIAASRINAPWVR